MQERPISPISFHQYLNEEKLMGSKCKKCGKLYSPPRPICLSCRGTEMDWVPLKGKGKLATYTCIHVGPPWMVEQGYDREHPYCSGVVDLEEGVKIDARIEGVDASKPESIKPACLSPFNFCIAVKGIKCRPFWHLSRHKW